MSTLVFRLMDELDQTQTCALEPRPVNFLLVRASGKGVVRHTQQQIAGYPMIEPGIALRKRGYRTNVTTK